MIRTTSEYILIYIEEVVVADIHQLDRLNISLIESNFLRFEGWYFS